MFVDKKKRFGWHDGQQLPGASLQVSFFKDLVSLSDPTSPFSFLAYLHEHGKLYHFLNAQFDAVPRQEFSNYMEWASRKNENVLFGEEVLSVEWDDTFVIRTDKQVLTADNLAIGVGSQPWIPEAGQDKLGFTQFHVSEYTNKAKRLSGKRVSVVGGGQSGAEAFLDLISRSATELPAQLSWISRRRNYLPLDDSPFTNDFYMPCHANYFFGLDREIRSDFNERFILTSDGISETTLRQIYQRIYMHRFVNGNQDLVSLHPNREVIEVSGNDAQGWELFVTHNDQPGVVERQATDVIIWATGFRRASMDFLSPIEGLLEREDKEYRIDEDFAVCWGGPADHKIFLQNAAPQQRGLADLNLSLIAWRSQRIVDRLRGVRSRDQFASFIQWSGDAPGHGAEA